MIQRSSALVAASALIVSLASRNHSAAARLRTSSRRSAAPAQC
jgi:hypothetical protein